MAKAKKRVATRKKSSKRGKASAKPARKTAAKRTTPKEAKSKVRRAGSGAPKPAVKKKRPPKTAARKAPRKAPRRQVVVPVEDTIIDVIDEPAPGVIRRYGVRIDSDRLLPFRPAVSPSAAPVPRPKNNKSVVGQFENVLQSSSYGNVWFIYLARSRQVPPRRLNQSAPQVVIISSGGLYRHC